MGSLLIGRAHLLWGIPHSYISRYRLIVRTSLFHGGNMGSNPVSVTIGLFQDFPFKHLELHWLLGKDKAAKIISGLPCGT